MEKVELNESMSAKMYITVVYRVNLNKLLQIIMKLRWSNKDNNN